MTTLDPATTCRPSRSLALPPGTDATRRATTIAEAVQFAVRAIDESTLRRIARPDAGLAFQPRILLSILSYCYAWEVYGSADIEGWMRRDFAFRRACQHEFPNARQLRSFRRHNSEAIGRCLAAALEWLAESSGNIAASATTAIWIDEARRRLETARFIDCTELDGD